MSNENVLDVPKDELERICHVLQVAGIETIANVRIESLARTVASPTTYTEGYRRMAETLLVLRWEKYELDLVFEAIGWPCPKCESEPRVTSSGKIVYCATPCEDERAYEPWEWIVMVKAAEGVEG